MRKKPAFALFSVLSLAGIALLSFAPQALAGCSYCDSRISQSIEKDRKAAYDLDREETEKMMKDYPAYTTASGGIDAKIKGVTEPGGSNRGGGTTALAYNSPSTPQNVLQSAFSEDPNHPVQYFVKTNATGVLACAIQTKETTSADANSSIKENAVYHPDQQPVSAVPNAYPGLTSVAFYGSVGLPPANTNETGLRQLVVSTVDGTTAGSSGGSNPASLGGSGAAPSMSSLFSGGMNFQAMTGQGGMQTGICNQNAKSGGCSAVTSVASAASQAMSNLASKRDEEKLDGAGSVRKSPGGKDLTSAMDPVQPGQGQGCGDPDSWTAGHCKK